MVCVCNAIRECDVRGAARNGAATPCKAYRALGRQPRCGQCAPFARAIIDDERAAMSSVLCQDAA
ncbi:bacterioferritin-associated ferredoxin [uncultured Sphingomonas sp.]|uniref:(2Fe-2S)-binding protein n=1 Tax=uncultured Sphingomonas sp. TaxID=158754 RepID=UPI0035CB88A3